MMSMKILRAIGQFGTEDFSVEHHKRYIIMQLPCLIVKVVAHRTSTDFMLEDVFNK